MDKEYFRFYIKVRTALHIGPIAIHNELHTVFGDEAPSLRTVQRGSKWFHDVTGDESWFYHKQIGRKSSNAALVASGDPPPTMVRRTHFAPKTLLCSFFKSTGPVLTHSVKRGQTIDHQYYINNCLRPVIDEIRNQRPSLGVQSIKLHHDNGRPHMHEDVVNYLQLEGVTIMQHPPNSPDLAPCDF
ncbi:unnamed protein product [Rotaria sordida]|uniref:Transposase n=1 Tax=Rotaria sordida TaxID=392033 RepID=A0A819NTT5_9BILA|nr:unnamed protein product [Rotaria sordida]